MTHCDFKFSRLLGVVLRLKYLITSLFIFCLSSGLFDLTILDAVLKECVASTVLASKKKSNSECRLTRWTGRWFVSGCLRSSAPSQRESWHQRVVQELKASCVMSESLALACYRDNDYQVRHQLHVCIAKRCDFVVECHWEVVSDSIKLSGLEMNQSRRVLIIITKQSIQIQRLKLFI